MDPYEILHVRPGATKLELFWAYRRETRLWHPRHTPSIEALAYWKLVQLAYQQLTRKVPPSALSEATRDERFVQSYKEAYRRQSLAYGEWVSKAAWPWICVVMAGSFVAMVSLGFPLITPTPPAIVGWVAVSITCVVEIVGFAGWLYAPRRWRG